MEGSTTSILVIDDHEPWRRFVSTTLQKQLTLQIIGEAVDGLEAVQKAQQLKPDLILLDIGLPTLNGIETARPEVRTTFYSASSPTSQYLQTRQTPPAAIGRVYILQERFYHRDAKGQLRIMRTGPAPDEFETRDAQGYPSIKDQQLPSSATRLFAFDYSIFVGPNDIQRKGKQQGLIVSFHILNVEHAGNVSDYWTEPVTIALPAECKLSPN